MIKVFIAEDQLLFTQGLKMALSLYPEIVIIGSEQNGALVIESLIKTKPDILILDINMPGMDGISIAKELKKILPTVKILVLSSYTSKEFVQQMITLGASAYLHKNADLEELVHAIKEVHNNQQYFTKEISEMLRNVKKNSNQEGFHNLLGNKEIKVLSLLAQGLSIPKIAEQMEISVFTAETHKKNIMNKLGLNNVALLIKYATERGLI